MRCGRGMKFGFSGGPNVARLWFHLGVNAFGLSAWFVEFLYIQSTASLGEKVAWAIDRNCNPYPARFGFLAIE